MPLPDITVDIAARTATFAGQSIRLRGIQPARLLKALTGAAGVPLGFDECAEVLWGDVGWPENYSKHIQVVIAEMRKALAGRCRIDCVRHAGYVLRPVGEPRP